MKAILLSVNNVLVMKKGDDGQNLFDKFFNNAEWNVGKAFFCKFVTGLIAKGNHMSSVR